MSLYKGLSEAKRPFKLIFLQVSFIVLYWVMVLVKLEEIIGFLEGIAPPTLSEDWDNVGLQISPAQEEIESVLIGLDPSPSLLRRGREDSFDLIITHHPLIFEPIGSLTRDDPTGNKILNLIEAGTGLFVSHTNFDLAHRGLSYALARQLGLKEAAPLLKSEDELYKLITFVPTDQAQRVKKALFGCGAGRSGDYSHVSFSVPGEGTFKPLEGAHPHLGKEGELQKVREVRLELSFPPELKTKLLEELRRSHPYEDVAYEVYPTGRKISFRGLGRKGVLEDPWARDDFLKFLYNRLELPQGPDLNAGDKAKPEGKIRRIGVSPGAGGTVLESVYGAGLDLLIVGELDYHERLQAGERGLDVLELGHFHSEKIFSSYVSNLLQERFGDRELTVAAEPRIELAW